MATLPTSFWHLVAEEEDLPTELFDAIRLRIKTGEPEAPKKTTTWLANVFIEGVNKGDMDRAVFLTPRTELLPETWRSELSLDLLKPFTDQTDPTKINLKSNIRSRQIHLAAARRWPKKLKKGR
jgi:hypothetical protein